MNPEIEKAKKAVANMSFNEQSKRFYKHIKSSKCKIIGENDNGK